MLPAEMASVADGTRARVHQREQECAEDGDGDEDPEVVLANGENGDNPPPKSQSSLNEGKINLEMNMHSE